MKLKEALAFARLHLAHYPDAAAEASFLLSAVLKKDRALLYAYDERVLTQSEIDQLHDWLAKRAKGRPLAYLVGEKAFWDFSLYVNEHTLIPRPETELLVEAVLDYYAEPEGIHIADLGTGSGAIALAIKKMRPNWFVWGVDFSNAALAVASANAKRLDLAVNFLESNWCDALGENSLDVLVSNPPYLSKDDPHLKGEIAFEPQSALVADEAGLAAYRAILKGACRVLKPTGKVFFEHGKDQRGALDALLVAEGFTVLAAIQDYQSHDRILVAQYG